jgi:hypothetical protein
MRIAEINYNQVVNIRTDIESIEVAYRDYYASNILLTEAHDEVLVGWGYDEENNQYIQPSAEGMTYYAEGEYWMLLPDGLTQEQIVADIRDSRIKQNQDIVDYSIDKYTMELIAEGVIS